MSKRSDSSSTLYQLPFLFHLHETQTFKNFYPGSNEVVLSCLKQLTDQHDLTHAVYLWGHRFVGCTHLLKASCEAFTEKGLRSLYLSLEEIQKNYQPSALSPLIEDYDLVCFDTIDTLNTTIEWEKALFSVYNQLAAQHTLMIFAAHQVPHQLSLKLSDLVSRLNSGLLFQVHELNDQQKASALQLRAHLRGLELTEGVAQFLLSRLPRSARALLDALNQLDKFASAKQRKLTMPFVKEVLEI